MCTFICTFEAHQEKKNPANQPGFLISAFDYIAIVGKYGKD